MAIRLTMKGASGDVKTNCTYCMPAKLRAVLVSMETEPPKSPLCYVKC